MTNKLYGEDLANTFTHDSEEAVTTKEEVRTLPAIVSLKEAMENLPELGEELIEGVLRVGHKMLLSGASKSGKSLLLMQLCIALAENRKWLGFPCKKSRVLYVNLEIDKRSCINRFASIYDALDIVPEHSEDIIVHNLRGQAKPLNELTDLIIEEAIELGVDAIIIDPLYKVITGDENSATDMSKLCNCFDSIAYSTGAAVIYAHHHSKGAQGGKSSMDRASGSGVFARDPDALIDLIELKVSREEAMDAMGDTDASAYAIEGTLREFPKFKRKECWFLYPIHFVQEDGSLEKCYAAGDRNANLAKSPKRNVDPDAKRARFDAAFNKIATEEDGHLTCSMARLSEDLGSSMRTIQGYIREYSSSYSYSKDIITKLD